MLTRLYKTGRAALALVLLGAGFLTPGTAARPGADARAGVEQLIRESGAEAVAVAFYDLASGRQMLINADESFHAASTMKVPVMMEVFRQAREGKLSLTERVTIKNRFASIIDG